MTKIVGLTGGIASGKSTVSKMFRDRHIPVIDTDKIARDLLNKGTDVYHQVLHHFSKEIILTNGEINRKLLGRIIFSNPMQRQHLNDIVHPHVIGIVDREVMKYNKSKEPIIVIDVPLLFETNFQEKCDKTIVVYTSPGEQLSRLIARDVIKKDYAKMKIEAQMPLNDKADMADYVINNSFSILRTKKDFLKILEELEVE